MFPAYVAVTLVAAAANLFSAGCDFVRLEQIAVNMSRAGVPVSWMTMLGILKAAGAIGLLAGIAAAGLVLFFAGAIVTHIRGHFYEFTLPVIFLALAVAALLLRLATA